MDASLRDRSMDSWARLRALARRRMSIGIGGHENSANETMHSPQSVPDNAVLYHPVSPGLPSVYMNAADFTVTSGMQHFIEMPDDLHAEGVLYEPDSLPSGPSRLQRMRATRGVGPLSIPRSVYTRIPRPVSSNLPLRQHRAEEARPVPLAAPSPRFVPQYNAGSVAEVRDDVTEAAAEVLGQEQLVPQAQTSGIQDQPQRLARAPLPTLRPMEIPME